MIVKILDRHQHGKTDRPSRIYCVKCGHVTKDGKPYCSKHVADNAYVSKLLKHIKNQG